MHTRYWGPISDAHMRREIEMHKKACPGVATLSYSTHDTRRYLCTVCIGFKCFGRVEECTCPDAQCIYHCCGAAAREPSREKSSDLAE
jgi:hypothetical protein